MVEGNQRQRAMRHARQQAAAAWLGVDQQQRARFEQALEFAEVGCIGSLAHAAAVGSERSARCSWAFPSLHDILRGGRARRLGGRGSAMLSPPCAAFAVAASGGDVPTTRASSARLVPPLSIILGAPVRPGFRLVMAACVRLRTHRSLGWRRSRT